jgi:uncharacterized YccA/Bax inhibitor family protein
MAYKTGNPALRKDTFARSQAMAGAPVARLQTFKRKSRMLAGLSLLSALIGWWVAARQNGTADDILLVAGMLAIVVAWIQILKRQWSVGLAPLFGLLHGFVSGILVWATIIGVGGTKGGPYMVVLLITVFGIGMALNVSTDLKTINERLTNQTARYMEWYSAFSLLVSTYWFVAIVIYLFNINVSHRRRYD